MKIAVAGAGGMGGRFALCLHQSGNDVILIDQWQANIKAIRKDGLTASLNGKVITDQIPIYYPDEIDEKNEKVDLILAMVKSPQLDQMFHAISPIIQDDTYVLCLMNGIGHEDTLSRYVNPAHILSGTTMWTATMKGPGLLELNGEGSIDIQNIRPEGKQAADKVIEVLNQAGLNARYSDNVLASIWRKACITGGLNALTALLECNNMELRSLQVFDSIILEIVKEYIAVAEKEGIHLNQTEMIEAIQNYCRPTVNGFAFTSMYQDLIQNHRITEIEYMNGAISRKGKQYGIPTPYNELLTQLIHAKEQLLTAF